MTTDASDTCAGAGAGASSGTNANAELHGDVPLLTNGIENAAATKASAGQNTTDTNGVSSDVLGIIGENNAVKEPFRTGQALGKSAMGFDDIIYAEWFQKLLNDNPDAAGTLLFGMGLDWPYLVGTRWFQNLRASSDPAAFGRFCKGFLLPKPAPTSTATTSAIHSSGTFNGDEGSSKKKSLPTTTSTIETVAQIVPFLMSFPKLSAAFLGLWDGGSRHDYTLYNYSSRRGDQAVIRGLVEQFCGAFEAGALPSTLDLKGLLACRGDDDGYGLGKVHCAGGGGVCRACNRICSSFPFNVVVRLVKPGSTCIPDAVRISALRDRPGSTEYFRSEAAIDGLLCTLRGYVHRITIRKDSQTRADQNFIQRMTERGCADSHGDFDVQYLPSRAKETLRAVVASGFEVTLAWASRTKLMDSAHSYYFCTDIEEWDDDDSQSTIWVRQSEIWVRSSLNFLIALGFDLDPDDFFLVDPLDDPAVLQRMLEEEEE